MFGFNLLFSFLKCPGTEKIKLVERVNDNKKGRRWACYSRGTTKKNERGAGKCGVKGLVGVGRVTYFLLDVCVCLLVLREDEGKKKIK